VATLSAKRAAEQDAKNTLGVNRVTNHLKVRPEEWPGDAAISERVRESLSRDSHLQDTDVSSASHFGKLYLDGTVDSRFQKVRAEVVAANLPGVLEVVNRLKVNHPEVTKPDREIQQDIQRRLQSYSLLGNDPIDVSVSDGTATLKGVIDTFQQRSLMENMALRAGALRVHSDLVVRSGRKAMDGLVAELVNLQEVYALDSERSGKHFRDFLQAAKQNPRLQDRLPPAPDVNLVLRLHNEGTEPAEVRIDHDLTEIELGLTGKEAVHVSLRRDFVAVFRPGRVVVIEPGDDYEIPIDSLQYGFRNAAERWYWTQPGDYKLQATFTWPTDTTGFFQYAVTTKPIPLTVQSIE
jgi:osmotically-inducible protein OsmY